MTPVPALRAKPPADARRRILDAAVAEFVARGFEGASTNTIARVAGVAKGLVFHHFGSKSDLFLAITTALVQRFKDAALHMPATGFVERVSRLLEKTRFVGNPDDRNAS